MTTFKKYLKTIGLSIIGLMILVVIFRSCYSSNKKSNADESTTSSPQKTERGITQAFSYTVPVSYGTEYGEPVFLPSGYDVTFITHSTNEYCVKNKINEACGTGDISGKLPSGSENTQGMYFKGEKEGSLEILLVKNDNL